MDQSKKTMRHFYCRDVLWETFEQMANDFDCSIDYLVNEAMRYYARSKNYQSPNAGQPPAVTGPGPQVQNGPSGYPPTTHANNKDRQARGPSAHVPPAQQGQGQGMNTAGPTSLPANRDANRTRQPPTPGYPAQQQNRPGQNTSGSQAGPAPQPPNNHPTMGSSGPTLFLIYNGQRFPVTKDQFIIGRGSKTSDLAIKDGNISRKHAAVIRRNGTFYIKDLGSTNGIDYKGMRIDNKRIDEGDVFHLCDYELRFTYRAD